MSLPCRQNFCLRRRSQAQLLRGCDCPSVPRRNSRVRSDALRRRICQSSTRVTHAFPICLQLEMVRQHLHRAVPQQDRSLRSQTAGRDNTLAVLRGLYGSERVRASEKLHGREVQKPIRTRERAISPFHVCNGYESDQGGSHLCQRHNPAQEPLLFVSHNTLERMSKWLILKAAVA